jgi:uncharacterized protein with FMN-binding domain
VAAQGRYKDGVYVGIRWTAMYGMVQVAAIIRDGRLVVVDWLDYPQDREQSVRLNVPAIERLTREAIRVQSADVDMITGATLTSGAFWHSLRSALEKAKK